MHGKLRKVFGALLPALLCVQVFAGIRALAQEEALPGTSPDTQQSAGETDEEEQAIWDLEEYAEYRERYGDMGKSTQSLEIPAAAASVRPEGAKVYTDYLGDTGESLYTEETGYSEWTIDVPQTGRYAVEFVYCPVEGRGGKIERNLYLDGKIPFKQAASFRLSRIWKAQSGIVTGSDGNDVRPQVEEASAWISAYFQDVEGFYTDPLELCLEKGTHTIGLEGVREPMLLKAIRLVPLPEPDSYADTLADWKAAGYEEAENSLSPIQAEAPARQSEESITPLSDRSSPGMVPYSAQYTRLNMIGSDKWQEPGQWIEWTIHVDSPGLYKIGFRFKQDLRDGTYVSRRLTIDGELPFKEAEEIRFAYDGGWQSAALGGEEPYLFYLSEGDHTLRLEVTLGELSSVLRRLQESTENLSAAYSRILMITGANPDIYRDYNFPATIPDVLESIRQETEIIKGIRDEMMQQGNADGEQIPIMNKLILDLDAINSNPKNIAKRLSSFKSNTGALTSWTLEACKQGLKLDEIYVQAPGEDWPSAEKGILAQIVHHTKLFLYSFVNDYQSAGAGGAPGVGELRVWVGTGALGGRDQAQILRQMIQDTFTPDTGIPVRVELVATNALLPATLSGTGPDVALQVANSLPVNFATRQAALDISQLEGFDEVIQRFSEAAMIPYQYNGGVYALPETFTFPMMFYRTDILDELGLEPPETWDDLYAILPELQKRNLTIGIPAPVVAASAVTANPGEVSSYVVYGTLLAQNGLPVYEGNGKSCLFDGEAYISLFKQWTDLYVYYEVPKTYDFVNRFRTGEMPLGIADYSTYNQLSVFAPEIRGKWGFALVPGTRQEDGTIDHTTLASGGGCVMLRGTDDIESAWKFMTWWTDAPAQSRFASEVESLMGTAARYTPANLEAMEKIPWSTQEYTSILSQWEQTTAIPEVPGGYMTARYLDFAYKAVVNQGADPGEQLIQYTQKIDDELRRKRQEFGLE